MIAVAGLTYTYPKTTSPAITGLNFQVNDGEIFGFLDPSGAGKSTTQKILIGLLPDYQGDVAVAGKKLAAWGAEDHRIGGPLCRADSPLLCLVAGCFRRQQSARFRPHQSRWSPLHSPHDRLLRRSALAVALRP